MIAGEVLCPDGSKATESRRAASFILFPSIFRAPWGCRSLVFPCASRFLAMIEVSRAPGLLVESAVADIMATESELQCVIEDG